jgi:hypothetical protein
LGWVLQAQSNTNQHRSMTTDCSGAQLEFQGLGSRQIVGAFSGVQVTSDAGGLLLREVETTRQIVSRFAACFADHRKPELIEHSVLELVGQRVFGLCLGYEDLSDHDVLRRDPMLAVLVGKLDPTGESRARQRDRGCALCGKSTLNRLELTPCDAGPDARYKKIVYDAAAVDRFFVDVFLDSYEEAPKQIVLDLDATDDPLHGNQEGRFFHGYYGHYCYLPLYIFCGDDLLVARLRPSNIDACAGTVDELRRIVPQIRARWPKVRIILRADSGFAREDIMHFCEENGLDYVFGLARNPRLQRVLAAPMEKARRKHLRTGRAARVFRSFRYRTHQTWSRARRVIGKAEYLDKGDNPRFVVTSILSQEMDARTVYEDLYCARGDMENRIKEQQLGMFADRTSTATMRANQLRLYFSSVAYILMKELRRLGLRNTELERAQVSTIRTRLLKIGAVVSVTVRRVFVQFTRAFPKADLFRAVLARLRPAPA